jgi:membrane protease YdiL (CAAX protease family)
MAIASVLATLAMCTIEKRPFGTYGLGGRSKIRFLVIGLVTGGASLALLLGFLRLLGMFRFGYFSNSWLLLLHYGLLYAALFCAVAVAEETMFRGYVLVSLSQSISFWPSTIILSWIFASVHSFNASENRWGLISAGVYGIIQAYSFRRTGSLWFAIGVHATWDFAQSFVFGVPDSGTVLPGAMLRGTVSGPAWITGGKVGPEGSILMLLIFSIQLLIIWRISRNKHAPVTHIEDELAVPV